MIKLKKPDVTEAWGKHKTGACNRRKAFIWHSAYPTYTIHVGFYRYWDVPAFQNIPQIK